MITYLEIYIEGHLNEYAFYVKDSYLILNDYVF